MTFCLTLRCADPHSLMQSITSARSADPPSPKSSETLDPIPWRARRDLVDAHFASSHEVLASLWQGLRCGAQAAGIGIHAEPASALALSRAALDQTRAGAPGRMIGVVGPDVELAAAVTAVLGLIQRIRAERTAAEWRMVDLLVPGVRGQQGAVAEALGVTPQAVSKALLRTGWAEELAGRHAAESLLSRLADTTRPTPE